MNEQNLEPAAEDLLRSGKNNADALSPIPALYSIAISLKRIADQIEGDEEHMGIVEAIGTSIEQSILSARQQ
jgi:hypothetical protein